MIVILFDDEPCDGELIGDIKVPDDWDIEKDIAEWQSQLGDDSPYGSKFLRYLEQKYPWSKMTTLIGGDDYTVILYDENMGYQTYALGGK